MPNIRALRSDDVDPVASRVDAAYRITHFQMCCWKKTLDLPQDLRTLYEQAYAPHVPQLTELRLCALLAFFEAGCDALLSATGWWRQSSIRGLAMFFEAESAKGAYASARAVAEAAAIAALAT